MTDKRHISIILTILLAVLATICYRTGDPFIALLAYIVGCCLLGMFFKWCVKRLGEIEDDENKKPL